MDNSDLGSNPYKDSGSGPTSNSNKKQSVTGLPRGIWRALERQIIDERKKAVEDNPDLRWLDPWNLSRVFYTVRKRLDDGGYNVTELVKIRNKIHNYVKEYCDELGIKRHEIGIYAADRAILAFRGRLHSVGFADIAELAKQGTDIICIEKKNVVDRLVRFTKDFGIALVQSQGFMSEYGEMLVKLARKYGANVAILTDFDDSGVLLGYKLVAVRRFGIDIDTINEINEILDSKLVKRLIKNGRIDKRKTDKINIALLQEDYKRDEKNHSQVDDDKQNHWKTLELLSKGKYKVKNDKQERYIEDLNEYEDKKIQLSYLHKKVYWLYLNKRVWRDSNDVTAKYVDFLMYRRIELDSIMTYVDPEVFWIWLRNKILKEFKKRNYNRSVDVPEYVYTPTMEEFIKSLQRILSKKLEDKNKHEKTNLDNIKHLIDVDKKENKIKNSMVSILLDNNEILYLDTALREFMEQYLL